MAHIENEMRVTLASHSSNEAVARSVVTAFIMQMDPSVGELADIKTAVSEAVTNAIVHGYRNSSGNVEILCRILERDVLYIRVRDKGCGIPDVKKAMEPLFTTVPEEERAGLGFAVMESFMDSVSVKSAVGKASFPQALYVPELTKMSAADIASAASATDEKLRRDKLVTENLGLVHLCANRFRGRGVEYEELYSSGCVGLVKAAGAFDEERGVKFSTYAVPVILGEIKRVFRDGGTVKVSRSLKELSMKVTREKADFILKNGREPTVCELADIMGESAENIAEALSAALPCISLTGGEDEDGRQQDIPSPFREADIYEGIALRQVMDRLSADDRRLIFLRYFKGLTQSRTADMLGMTQVQVSRREKKILGELRRELV